MNDHEIEIIGGGEDDEMTEEEVAEFEAEADRMAQMAQEDDGAYWQRELSRLEAERLREYASADTEIVEAQREAEEQIIPRKAGRPRVYDTPRQLVQIMLATELVDQLDTRAGYGNRTAFIERAIRAALSQPQSPAE